MLSGKIYDYIKEYISDYLFGFDRSQIDTSLLSGKMKIKRVNIKPEKINQMIENFLLPVQLKAGIINFLELKIGKISMDMWNIPITVNIDTLLLILGPSTSHMSQEDDFVPSHKGNYDPDSCFNFLDTNLKLQRGKMDDEKYEKLKKEKREEVLSAAETMTEMMKKLKKLKLNIRKVHIRYEDDYFEAENPFSFGVIADEITLDTQKDSHSYHHDEEGDIVSKILDAKNIRSYWNSMSETFIPTSLWEQTKDLDNRIFEAIAADDLFELMYEPFESRSGKQYFSNKDELILPFNLKFSLDFKNIEGTKMSMRMDLNIDSLKIEINDKVIADLKNMLKFWENFKIAHMIKKYVPQNRPIVESTAGNSQSMRRKRKLIARDWWQLVIWANRMKKVRALQSDPRYFEHIRSMKRSKNKESLQTFQDILFLKDFTNELQEVQKANDVENSRLEVMKILWKHVSYSFDIGFISVDYHGENSKSSHGQMVKNKYPLLRFEIDSFVMKYKIDRQGRQANIYFDDLEVKQYCKVAKAIPNGKSTARIRDCNIPRPNRMIRNQSFLPNQPKTVRRKDPIDNTLSCIERQERLMMGHQRATIESSFEDDPIDEFDSIGESKINSINNTIFATKMINKGNKKSFMQSSASLLHPPRHISKRPSSSSRYHDEHIMMSSRRNSFADEKEIESGIREKILFSISSENNSGAFSYEVMVGYGADKITRLVQIGQVSINMDPQGLKSTAQAFENCQDLLHKVSDKPDITNDAFWWLFSRKVLQKLKNEENKENRANNTSNELARHNQEVHTKMKSQDMSNRSDQSMQRDFEKKNFTELYEVFIEKFDKDLFGTNDIQYQINIKGCKFLYKGRHQSLNCEAPPMNLNITHNKGSLTHISFLGFKLTTDMTVRPIVNILKTFIQVDSRQEKLQESGAQTKVCQSLEKARKDPKNILLQKPKKQKEEYRGHSKCRNQKLNKFEGDNDETMVIDESIHNTTPLIGTSKPSAKKEEAEPVAPNLIITPKSTQKMGHGRINRYYFNKAPNSGQSKKFHKEKIKTDSSRDMRTDTKAGKIPHNFNSNFGSKFSQRKQNTEMKKAYVDVLEDIDRRNRLDDEISSISTRSELMNGAKRFNKPNLGINVNISSQRQIAAQRRTPQNSYPDRPIETAGERKTSGFLDAYKRRAGRTNGGRLQPTKTSEYYDVNPSHPYYEKTRTPMNQGLSKYMSSGISKDMNKDSFSHYSER
ncbi:unnamed protein product [Moneuplotes crassus]|uniref:Chorein N-terminal domain-containing protein n=1 Tax=Euplotes crassus TaxID=5936 RepID=A0AAD1UIU0_EUPCR|nr:unnamed protein product [Moneuplotes crassus]